MSTRPTLVALRLLALRFVLPLATRRVALPRLVRLVARPRGEARPREQDLATRLAARLWQRGDSPCLGRSLALFAELGRLGGDVVLVCGIAPGSGARVGHAWVEQAGDAVLERGDPRTEYRPLVAFDRTGMPLAEGRL
jgi:hypothetical protein